MVAGRCKLESSELKESVQKAGIKRGKKEKIPKQPEWNQLWEDMLVKNIKTVNMRKGGHRHDNIKGQV